MLLGGSERHEVDGRVSIEVADVGRTFQSDVKSNKVCTRNVLGKTCGKVAHTDNRTDGIRALKLHMTLWEDATQALVASVGIARLVTGWTVR
jgi:hypothetical protein